MGFHRLLHSQFVPRPRAEVFAFFADPVNLQRLTPAFLHFKIVSSVPISMGPGALIDYELRLCGIRLRWRSRIESFDPDDRFSDVQVKGPYRLWHHLHEFFVVPGGTEIRDTVEYELPLGAFGDLARFLFVRSTLERIFDFRRQAVTGIFGS